MTFQEMDNLLFAVFRFIHNLSPDWLKSLLFVCQQKYKKTFLLSNSILLNILLTEI